MKRNNLPQKELQFFRASILHFTDDPHYCEDCFEYYEDGLLVLSQGKVLDLGETKTLKRKYKESIHTKNWFDHSGKLIMPGFIDTHIHYPQTEMVASYGNELMNWLENYTFPTEAKFSDEKYARKVAKLFLNQLLLNGTTTALVFPTVHPESVDAFFKEAHKRKLRMISGKVLMDRNAPKNLLDTPTEAYNQSKSLIKKWHGKGRLCYALTPRFAVTSSKKQLQVCQKLLKEFPDIYMQTHLAENHGEIELVKKLFPKSRSYLDVYHNYGLTGKRSVFAHCLHLDNTDYKVMAKTDSSISFCPTSNLFLGSGFFKLAQAQKHQINVGLGTDIGAGTSFNLLQTMNEAYKVIKVQKSLTKDQKKKKEITPLSALQAFYLATLGGARALSLEDKIGSFAIGNEADFIVLNPNANEFMQFRMDQTKTLEEKLFAIMMLGNQEMIEQTFIMGTPIN